MFQEQLYPLVELPERIGEITILRPGGNDTALVPLLLESPAQRKSINNAIMTSYPNVEQVGFYSLNPPDKAIDAQLIMAGGEFCGNATRSTTFLALNGQPGEIKIAVSGTPQILKAGIDDSLAVWSQMPILKNFSCIQRLNDLAIVALEGITHVISPYPFVNKVKAKTTANQILEKLGLKTTQPAAGVLFLTENPLGIKMDPFVYVRNIETFFYETACASGTTAVGLAKSLMENQSFRGLPIIQPSDQIIYVSVERNENEFISAIISGPVEVLGKISISL